jgi:anaerobic ribonucleoside-triphosphate reductase
MANFETKCPQCKGPVIKHGDRNWCEACRKMFCGRKCEVFSRVVGYFRPITNWNLGKQEEFKGRRSYQVTAQQLAENPVKTPAVPV